MLLAISAAPVLLAAIGYSLIYLLLGGGLGEPSLSTSSPKSWDADRAVLAGRSVCVPGSVPGARSLRLEKDSLHYRCGGCFTPKKRARRVDVDGRSFCRLLH